MARIPTLTLSSLKSNITNHTMQITKKKKKQHDFDISQNQSLHLNTPEIWGSSDLDTDVRN